MPRPARSVRRLSRIAIVLVVPLAAAAGCGGDDSSEDAAATATAGPPAELLGTYTTTLKAADVPAKPPPELADQRRWRLKITKDGGPDDGPALTILRPPSDALESSKLSTSGDVLTLSDEECAPTDPAGQYTLVTSSYRWALDGDTLRLETVKSGCTDKVVQTILTAEPWKKQP